MIQQGADIIDVGGESTRPGHVQIGDEEEIKRVVPVIREIKKKFDIPVSIDTYKSAVAKAALEAGADLLNDIWGFRYDEKMAELAAEYDVPVCLMHNRDNLDYDDFMEDVKKDLQISLDIAEKYGVKKENIMLDPGVGFGKTYEQNLMVMNHLEEIVDMGYPVLLGTSRKSVIGLTLDLPVDEREEGTLATSVLGAIKGCQFVRVHDVEKNGPCIKNDGCYFTFIKYRGETMDRICIKDLEIYCHHGVLEEETALGQKFLVSIQLYTDTKAAGEKDDLSLSVNYADICHFAERKMKEKVINCRGRRPAPGHGILLEFDRWIRRGNDQKPWAAYSSPAGHGQCYGKERLEDCVSFHWVKSG